MRGMARKNAAFARERAKATRAVKEREAAERASKLKRKLKNQAALMGGMY